MRKYDLPMASLTGRLTAAGRTKRPQSLFDWRVDGMGIPDEGNRKIV